MKKELLKIEEVALIVGVSYHTINTWYRWKRLHPDHELAKLLPDFIQKGNRQTRYWSQADVWSIVAFKERLPRGRNGILADVTQKYIRNRTKKDDVNCKYKKDK